MPLSNAATPAAAHRLNMRSSSDSDGTSAAWGAPRTIHPPQASANTAAASEGSHKTGSQAGCTAAATSSTCSWVDTQDNRPPPASNRTSAGRSRAASPSVAMVAVLDTKPEASADNATAWRACSRRRLRWARACTPSSRATSCTMTWGLSTGPHSGRLGTSGSAISTSAARMMPSRTSPGLSQWLAKWCSRWRPASKPVRPTAVAAASGRLQAQSTPIR